MTTWYIPVLYGTYEAYRYRYYSEMTTSPREERVSRTNRIYSNESMLVTESLMNLSTSIALKDDLVSFRLIANHNAQVVFHRTIHDSWHVPNTNKTRQRRRLFFNSWISQRRSVVLSFLPLLLL